jgi:hypothetical protein|tara:strand:+ start:506 stop:715 length:210 start_codon:yes stop_codon:yes gene_type:complete
MKKNLKLVKTTKTEKPAFTKEQAITHLSSIGSLYLREHGKKMHQIDREMLEESIKIVDGYYEYIKWPKS